MPPVKMVKLLATNALALGVGALVATSCIGVDYPNVAFRCNPSQPQNCPDDYICCSDDASRIDGTLLFAGLRNDASSVGMCIRDGLVALGDGLPEKPQCPVPCNPTWAQGTVAEVCGAGFSCCQTVEITENDCVFDAESGLWHAARGQDVLDELSKWQAAEHDTHQDPGGSACLALGALENPSAPGSTQIFLDCLLTLGVADTRGFCRSLEAGTLCPTQDPSYRDACQLRNGV